MKRKSSEGLSDDTILPALLKDYVGDLQNLGFMMQSAVFVIR